MANIHFALAMPDVKCNKYIDSRCKAVIH